MKIFKIKKEKLNFYLNLFEIIINKDLKKSIIIKKFNNNLFIILLEENFKIIIKIKKIYKINFNFVLNIPFKELYNIIKSFKNNSIIKFYYINNRYIKIKCNNVLFKILIIKNIKTILIKNELIFNNKIKLKNKIINYLINSVYFFINKKNEKKNNIFLYIGYNKILILINDNFSLVFNKIIFKKKFKIIKKILIKGVIIKILKELVKNKKNNFKIEINKNFIKIKIKNIEIISSIKNTDFPKINFKLMKKYKINFNINIKELSNSLKRSLIIKNNIIFTKWKIFKNYLTIKSENEEILMKEKLKLNFFNKNKIEFLINTKHLTNFMKNLKHKDLNINISKNKKYFIIKIPYFKNFKYIITSLNFN